MTDEYNRFPRFLRLLEQRSVLPLAKVFVILVGISLIASDAWMTWNARVTRLKDAQIETSNLAFALAQHAQDTLKKADTILIGLVERLAEEGAGPAQLRRLQQLLGVQVVDLPELQGLFVYDQSGQQRVTSLAAAPAVANHSDREYFIYHREHADRQPHIGLPMRSHNGGDWVIPVSRRLEDAEGQFAGVVLATVAMDYFQRFYSSFELNEKGAIALTLDTGTVLVRQPFQERAIGTDLAASPIFSEYLPKSPVGNARFVSLLDGEARLYSYRHLQGYPLVVTAALSQAEVLTNWRQDAYLQLGVVTLLALLLGLLGFHLIRLIKGGLNAEAQLLAARDTLESLNQRLEKLALEDELTLLANRRRFMAALTDELQRAARYKRSLALVMMDIDYFKQYNDMYGHAAGDQCLRRVAQVIKNGQKRSGDLGARYGGEEFCLLLPETDAAGAQTVAEQIRQALEASQIVHSGSPLGVVTLSAGVHAFVPAGEAEGAAMLMHCADRALYQAKAKGRNQLSVFDVSLFKQRL
ncbi:sensor domain-containing diguanylate cyclase [Pseudomonas sp. 2FG]|uniref:sensor domain-containing diguanylate cyclase n=1 Tax=Pseudomonas sp. 2FG TaxID=2502191 RepID=UPI001C4992D6|nr:sensor domain-containing diguanylate cyclase [Pseudomonas sp. 2FG]